MIYDDWTDSEIWILRQIKGLNRMELDEFLGELENGQGF